MNLLDPKSGIFESLRGNTTLYTCQSKNNYTINTL